MVRFEHPSQQEYTYQDGSIRVVCQILDRKVEWQFQSRSWRKIRIPGKSLILQTPDQDLAIWGQPFKPKTFHPDILLLPKQHITFSYSVPFGSLFFEGFPDKPVRLTFDLVKGNRSKSYYIHWSPP